MLNVKDKVRHFQKQVLGTITEKANRVGTAVYRVDWKEDIDGKNFTWHTEEELVLESVIGDILNAFVPENINQEVYRKLFK